MQFLWYAFALILIAVGASALFIKYPPITSGALGALTLVGIILLVRGVKHHR